MSDLIEKPQLQNSKDCPAAAAKPERQNLKTRAATVGENIVIRRALPHRDRRMIGAWCFLDHFGPLNLKNSDGLRIGPHPHIGLQTFTYTLAGEILHRDSLGSKQVIQPGEVNLMTAGKGISHSEESLPDTVLHGVQLWIALPNAVRQMEPSFIHYQGLPTVKLKGLDIHVLAGEFFKARSEVQAHSPLVGMEIHATEDASVLLPLNPQFEYGVLPLVGEASIENETVGIDNLLYLGCGHANLPVQLKKGSRLLIIGGEPFKEEILIWWNFVARTKEEITQATQAWNSQKSFGEVKGYQGERLVAPPLPF